MLVVVGHTHMYIHKQTRKKKKEAKNHTSKLLHQGEKSRLKFVNMKKYQTKIYTRW